MLRPLLLRGHFLLRSATTGISPEWVRFVRLGKCGRGSRWGTLLHLVHDESDEIALPADEWTTAWWQTSELMPILS